MKTAKETLNEHVDLVTLNQDRPMLAYNIERAMEDFAKEYASEQLSEQRRKIEELIGLCKNGHKRNYVFISELTEILKEN